MSRFLYFLIVLLLPACVSCAMLGGPQQNTRDQSDISQGRQLWPIGETHQQSSYVRDGRFIDASGFKKGGSLFVSRFWPDENVADSEELDKVNLMIVRGLVDIFEEKREKLPLDLVFSDSEDDARFVLDGWIVNVSDKDKFLFWFGEEMKSLEIKGTLTDKQTDKTLAIFSDIVQTDGEKELKDLGRQIGQNIGRFVFAVYEPE